MLSLLAEAALRTLLLAATVQFALWVLRVRRLQVLLTVWTAVLAASLSMPALQWAMPLHLAMTRFDYPTAWLADACNRRHRARRHSRRVWW